MSKEEVNFNQWLELRNSHTTAKRNKDFQAVIDLSKKIIAHSIKAPEIRIMAALFHKDIADSYVRLNDTPSAIAACREAIASFKHYRATERLSKPDDFLSDIEKLQKKLEKLENS